VLIVERRNLDQVRQSEGDIKQKTDNLELKVLPTQPDHPAIPEEEGDDEDAHERVVGDEAGVEVRLIFAVKRFPFG
jgi:hypothetical protein